MSSCTECSKNSAVSSKNDGNRDLCITCLEEYAQITMDLKIALYELQENVTPSQGKTKSPKRANRSILETAKKKVLGEKNRIDEQFRLETAKKFRELKLLLEHWSSANSVVEMIIGAYDNVMQNDGTKCSLISELTKKTNQSKTVESLKRVKKRVLDFENVSRLILSEDGIFNIKIGKSRFSEDEVTFGKNVVKLEADYEPEDIMDRLLELYYESANNTTAHTGVNSEANFDAGMSSTLTDDKSTQTESIISTKAKTVSNAPLSVPLKKKEKATTSADVRSTFCHSAHCTGGSDGIRLGESASPTSGNAKAFTVIPTENSPYLKKSRLPTTVDYSRKGKANVVIIGPNYEKKKQLKCPIGCAYHRERREILVACYDNQSITACSVDGPRSRTVCTVDGYPYDLAVSQNGQFLYIATSKSLLKVPFSGNEHLLKTIKECSFGRLGWCSSVVVHGSNTLVLSKSQKRVIIFDENDKEIRAFLVDEMTNPWSLAVSNNRIFITDTDQGCIQVFQLDGKYVTKVLTETAKKGVKNQIYAILIDGDENIIVSTLYDVQVYDSESRLTVRIGSYGDGAGQFNQARGMCWIGNGKIAIADQENNRLQLL